MVKVTAGSIHVTVCAFTRHSAGRSEMSALYTLQENNGGSLLEIRVLRMQADGRRQSMGKEKTNRSSSRLCSSLSKAKMSYSF